MGAGYLSYYQSTPAAERVRIIDEYRETPVATIVKVDKDEDDYPTIAMTQVVFYTFPVPEHYGNYRCDLCDETPAPGTIEYGNKSLNVGCCEKCFREHEDAGTLKQARYEILTKGFEWFFTPVANYSCDVCHKMLPRETSMYGSRQKNVDVCQECVDRAHSGSATISQDDKMSQLAAYLRVEAMMRDGDERHIHHSHCQAFAALQRELEIQHELETAALQRELAKDELTATNNSVSEPIEGKVNESNFVPHHEPVVEAEAPACVAVCEGDCGDNCPVRG